MAPQDSAYPHKTLDAVRLISEALAVSDHGRANELANAALAEGGVHPALFHARALWLERQNRDLEALADFERAASLAPKNVAILNAIGLCLTRLQRLEEAVSSFDQAIRVNPTYTPSYHRKGIALGMAGDISGARRAHEQAVRLNPRDADALASLASLSARQGETQKALDYAERALKLNFRQPTAIAAKALLESRRGRFEEAESLVRPLIQSGGLSGHALAVALGILADSLDGQDRTGEAFAAYRNENEELLRLHAPHFSALRSLTELTRDLSSHFQTTSQERLEALKDEDGRSGEARCHVFLLGFYRSGTTLLGQVLASHPEIVTLEERDFLLEPARQFLSDPPGIAKLATLPDAEIDEWRAIYWKKIAESGLALKGKVFVDKQPLNTIKLPLIARLFPRARIVFALRDPRDVVLSCFRRHFEINAAMFDLLTLEGAAALYDAVMQFAELAKPLFSRPFFIHRYEDMIADFDGRVRALCDELGVPFDPATRNFSATARLQEIRSPSATQVIRELNREGIGQWRRYRVELAPVLLPLRPWIEKFGYPQE